MSTFEATEEVSTTQRDHTEDQQNEQQPEEHNHSVADVEERASLDIRASSPNARGSQDDSKRDEMNNSMENDAAVPDKEDEDQNELEENNNDANDNAEADNENHEENEGAQQSAREPENQAEEAEKENEIESKPSRSPTPVKTPVKRVVEESEEVHEQRVQTPKPTTPANEPVQLPEVHEKEQKVETLKPQTPQPQPEFNGLQDVFSSLGNFFSVTKENLQKTSANVIEAVKSGSWKQKKEDSNAPSTKTTDDAFVPMSDPKPVTEPVVKTPTAEEIAEEKMRLQRIEEMRQMKNNYEANLRSLNDELNALERLQKTVDRNPPKEGDTLTMSKSHGGSKKMLIATEKKPSLGALKVSAKVISEGELRKKKREEPLFMKMEKQYVQQMVVPELERRKEELKAKREFYKPMEQQEFIEHENKYHENIQKELVHRQMERVERDQHIKAEKPNFYKSRALKRVLESDKEDRAKELQKVDEKKLMKDKMNQYGKLVKEMYFPKVEVPKQEPTSEDIVKEMIQKSHQAQVPLKAIVFKGSAQSKEKINLPWKKKPVTDNLQKSPILQNLKHNPQQKQDRGRYDERRSSNTNNEGGRNEWSESPIGKATQRENDEVSGSAEFRGPVALNDDQESEYFTSTDRNRVRGYKELLQKSREMKKQGGEKKPLKPVEPIHEVRTKNQQDEYEEGEEEGQEEQYEDGEQYEEEEDERPVVQQQGRNVTKPEDRKMLTQPIKKTVGNEYEKTKSSGMANYKKKDRSAERVFNVVQKEPEPVKKKYANYLIEVKKKRAEEEKNGAKIKYGHWDKTLKDEKMNKYEKMVSVMDEVERIEYQARLKEQKLKSKDVPRSMEPVDLEGQVTDMYLESIKAKLALIQNMS